MKSGVFLAWRTIAVNTSVRDFATIVTAPLRDLTKKDVRFEWTQTHQTAFETLKTRSQLLHVCHISTKINKYLQQFMLVL